LPQRTTSSLMKACSISGGGLVCGARPRRIKRSRISDCASTQDAPCSAIAPLGDIHNNTMSNDLWKTFDP
jgi:hypothetical protein